MAAGNTELAKLIEEKIKQYEGVLVPVKASPLERRLKKSVPIGELHPNPDDEFCIPSIGPNYGIISDYARKFQRFGTMTPEMDDEPLIVEKVHPDGYLILNGHHRWAAAMRVGFKKVPVSIVNLTQETDIEKMIRESTHDRRVTLDLDETVFCTDGGEPAEKPLSFPYNKVFKERMRRGIPALMHYLSMQGYDIWVYTAKYYSLEYIQKLFEKYSVKVDGIITGTSRKTKRQGGFKKKADSMLSMKYKETLHIDKSMVIRTFSKSGSFEEYEIDPAAPLWSKEVMKCLRKFEKNEEK